MKNPIIAGFIGGAIGGIIPFIQYHLYMTIGYLNLELSPFTYTIAFLANQATVHVGFNGIWGAIFSLFFARFFDRIPGKGIEKGLVIGFVYYLFSIVQPAYFYWVYDNPSWAETYLFGLYFFDKLIYGIIFAYLYKPSK